MIHTTQYALRNTLRLPPHRHDHLGHEEAEGERQKHAPQLYAAPLGSEALCSSQSGATSRVQYANRTARGFFQLNGGIRSIQRGKIRFAWIQVDSAS